MFITDAGRDRGGLSAGAEVNLRWSFYLNQEGVVRVGLLELRDGDSDGLLATQPFLFKQELDFLKKFVKVLSKLTWSFCIFSTNISFSRRLSIDFSLRTEF